MAVAFARLHKVVSSDLKLDLGQLINHPELVIESWKLSTRRRIVKRHDVCPISGVINFLKMEFFSQALITPAEGLHYPQRKHAPPFADPCPTHYATSTGGRVLSLMRRHRSVADGEGEGGSGCPDPPLLKTGGSTPHFLRCN